MHTPNAPFQLSQRTTLGVGGNATSARALSSAAELELVAARYSPAELLVLGGGSNLVVADGAVSGCVLDMQIRGIDFHKVTLPGSDVIEVVAGAGENWDALVALACERGLSGLECLSGIPGSVGATPIQNVGAYGQEVADTILWVEAFDLFEARHQRLSQAECEFGYRASRFKQREQGRWVVTRVCFRLRQGGPPSLRYAELERAAARLGSAPSLTAVRQLVLELRRSKSMLLDPTDENARSCGSFFTNPLVSRSDAARVARLAEMRGLAPPPAFPQANDDVKLAAGWLIEQAGLHKGTRDGNVGLSTRHALGVVAHAGATAEEVVRFAWKVRRRVEDAWGVRLVPEPVFWGFGQLDDGLPVLG